MSSRHFRIFVSSPGDVPDERAVAWDVIDNLPYDPAFGDHEVTVKIIAWDRPGAPPMEANIPPQEAINAGLPRPSDCDIVIVVFWTRMGTPLTIDGREYASGTEFEYRDAVEAAAQHGSPRVLVYKREQNIALDPDDPQFMERYQQYKRVKHFFSTEFADAETGSLHGGYNTYQTPEDLRKLISEHLVYLIMKLLKEDHQAPAPAPPAEAPELWQGNPFPGLRPFTPEDAPIFFGRGNETDKLIQRVRENQLVAVVGSSGSGKSSLVGAGLIPRLMKTSGTDQWRVVTFTPDGLGIGNPFASLAAALQRDLNLDEDKLAKKLNDDPGYLNTLSTQIVTSPDSRLLLFVDQFEELFTTVTDRQLTLDFITLIVKTLAGESIHIVLTVRGDFYGNCIEIPEFAEVLEGSTFPLSTPRLASLYEMIAKPAARAGLEFEDGLIQRILDDTGDDAGALALMAYLLDELYRRRGDVNLLRHQTYNDLGGVRGAIGLRSEQTFDGMTDAQKAALPRVFRDLVSVKDDGTVTRRRALASTVGVDTDTRAFVAALVKARLLVVSRGEDQQPYVEVAHEALLRSWDRLREWIETTKDDLQLRRKVRQAAEEWHHARRPGYLLWKHEQLVDVYAMQKRLGVTFSGVVQDFVIPEATRLQAEFESYRDGGVREGLYRQMNIVDRFKEIGEDAIYAMIICTGYTAGTSVKTALVRALSDVDDAVLLRKLQAALNSDDKDLRFRTDQFLKHEVLDRKFEIRVNLFSDDEGLAFIDNFRLPLQDKHREQERIEREEQKRREQEERERREQERKRREQERIEREERKRREQERKRREQEWKRWEQLQRWEQERKQREPERIEREERKRREQEQRERERHEEFKKRYAPLLSQIDSDVQAKEQLIVLALNEEYWGASKIIDALKDRRKEEVAIEILQAISEQHPLYFVRKDAERMIEHGERY